MAVGQFGVPFAVLVFPTDAARLARDVLFGGHAVCRRRGGLARREGFREGVAQLVGPAVCVLDNPVDHIDHG